MADQKRSRQDSLPNGRLPGDVMVSILINLPVKSLLKFKAVSKSWCSLISSNHFFKLHLHRQSVIAPNNCILSLRDLPEDEDEEQLDLEDLDLQLGLLDLTDHYHSFDDDSSSAADDDSSSAADDDSSTADDDDSAAADNDVFMLDERIPPFDLSLLASCNGLVCMGGIFKTGADVILWNPATRRYKYLDDPERDEEDDDTLYLDFPTLGLCYVDAINDFKILVWREMNSSDYIRYLYVYSLSSDSWDEEHFYDSETPKTNIYLNGAPTFVSSCMHWLAHKYCGSNSITEIVVYDVINKAKSWFQSPVSCGRRHHLTNQQLLVIGGCLSILGYGDGDGDGDGDDAQESGIGVWVMEEYGVEGSWVKRFFIQREFTQVKFPIVSWNDGEIVFNEESDDSDVLMFFDIYNGNQRYVDFSSHHVLKLFKYVESLASVELVEGGEGRFY